MGKPRGRRLNNDEAAKEPHSAIETEQKDTSQPFFGLVTSEESQYFKAAENSLNVDAFESPEEKQLYISSVLSAAKGIELKLMTNQICSKLMERLILQCTGSQLKSVFGAVSSHVEALSRHKYASHCVETLVTRAAAEIEKEVLGEEDPLEDGVYSSMESVFIYAVNELKPEALKLSADRYGSHVIRVVLLVLGGKPLPATTKGTSLLRSKKSKVARKMIEIKDTDQLHRHQFEVPKSFNQHLAELVQVLTKDMDKDGARAAAIDPVTSPVYQLVIQLEGKIDSSRPFFALVFEAESADKDEKEGAFVEHLLSDAVGSHFLEAAVSYGVQKSVTRLYLLYMKPRIAKLVRRKTTALFVIEHLLFKLKKNEAKYMLDQLIPDISEFIDINLDLAKAILSASSKLKMYRHDELVQQIELKYHLENTNLFESVLQLSTSTLGNTNDDWPRAEERWRALFFQSLMKFDRKLVALASIALVLLPDQTVTNLCIHGVFSHAVQSVLDPDVVDSITRRKVLNKFVASFDKIACNAYGSYIAEALWKYTVKMTVYKERMAGKLVENQDVVKESRYGRIVWKSWQMDLFVRKRSDWNRQVKEQEIEWSKQKQQEQEEQSNDDVKQKEKEIPVKRPNVGVNSGFSSKKSKRY